MHGASKSSRQRGTEIASLLPGNELSATTRARSRSRLKWFFAKATFYSMAMLASKTCEHISFRI
jgi:hypothetical protein